jgi:hypothetical protein
MHLHARWQALITDEFLLPIRGNSHRSDPKSGWADHNVCVFQHLRRPAFLPGLAEHLVGTREVELAAVLAKKREPSANLPGEAGRRPPLGVR